VLPLYQPGVYAPGPALNKKGDGRPDWRAAYCLLPLPGSCWQLPAAWLGPGCLGDGCCQTSPLAVKGGAELPLPALRRQAPRWPRGWVVGGGPRGSPLPPGPRSPPPAPFAKQNVPRREAGF
jgi:hypothetical protein